MAAAARTHARSLYRALLRELPPSRSATPNNIASPTPLRASIRQHFLLPALTTTKPSADAAAAAANNATEDDHHRALRQEAEQFVQYLKAQRVYGELLKRYNPGMDMEQEERVRLSARRVGMNMPVEHVKG